MRSSHVCEPTVITEPAPSRRAKEFARGFASTSTSSSSATCRGTAVGWRRCNRWRCSSGHSSTAHANATMGWGTSTSVLKSITTRAISTFGEPKLSGMLGQVGWQSRWRLNSGWGWLFDHNIIHSFHEIIRICIIHFLFNRIHHILVFRKRVLSRSGTATGRRRGTTCCAGIKLERGSVRIHNGKGRGSEDGSFRDGGVRFRRLCDKSKNNGFSKGNRDCQIWTQYDNKIRQQRQQQWQQRRRSNNVWFKQTWIGDYCLMRFRATQSLSS